MRYSLILLFAIGCGTASGTTTVIKPPATVQASPTVESFLAEVRSELKTLETERVTPKLEAKAKKISDLYNSLKFSMETENDEDFKNKVTEVAAEFNASVEQTIESIKEEKTGNKESHEMATLIRGRAISDLNKSLDSADALLKAK